MSEGKLAKISNFMLDWTIIISFIGVLVWGSVQIIARFVFGSPVFYSEELTRLFGIWMIFLGTSLAVGEHSHIKVDIFYNFLRGGLKMAADIIIDLCFLLFSLLVTYYGLKLAIASRILTSTALQWSMIFWFMPVVIGSFFNVLYLSISLKQTCFPVRAGHDGGAARA